MAKLHKIVLHGETFHARSGERLLDAALVNGVDLPHDCRAGRCGSCLLRVRSGITLGGETPQPGMVRACQAMAFSDLDLEIEPLPPVDRVQGKIVKLADLAEDIVEITIAPSRKLDMLPGQYCQFRFRGFPARAFSPTAPLATPHDHRYVNLNIKRVRDGRVTPHFGKSIRPGHAVWIEGPFGQSFLRPRLANRLVLVGSGTGFAPIWAVAAAALRENPTRSIVLIAATRRLASFYMAPALDQVRRFPNVSIIANVEELAQAYGSLVPGRAIDRLPRFLSDDIVYAAGAPALVEGVAETAEAAGATFYSDPFEPAAPQPQGWLESAKAWLSSA